MSDVTRRVLATLALLALCLVAVPAGAQQTSRRVADAGDPVTAALQLSRDTVADGDARLVVLGRSDAFPDNLAGAAATGAEGPLLLADPAPAPLAGDVLSEIQRVLGPRSGDCADREADVLVLGGEVALSQAVVDRIAAVGYCPLRLAGSERVGTSVAVASHRLQQFLEPGVSRGTLLIATAGNPADSASASAWAASIGASIVVTGQAALDPQVADLIQPGDTAWQEIILLGGEVALSEQVEQDVRDVVASGGFETTVRRIAGATRDDTALRVATELWDPELVSGAAIVNGFRGDAFWTTALPGAAAAARAAAPLLYVHQDAIPATTDAYLRQHPLEFLWTVGPASQVSEGVRQAAEASLGSGVTPDPPAEGAAFTYLDDGVLRDATGAPLTPPGDEVTGFDVNAAGDIAITVDGDLLCLCGGIGSEHVQVLHAPDTAEVLTSPVFTPEGDRVVVLNTFEEARDLQIVDLGGEDAELLTTSGDLAPIVSDQQFSPFGGIVYTSSGTDLVGVHLDGSGIQPFDLIGADPVVSPDGTALLYNGPGGTYIVATDGTGDAQLDDRVGPLAWLDDDVIIQLDARSGGLWAQDLRGSETLLTDDLSGMVFDLDVHPAEGQVLVADQTSVRVYDVAGGSLVVSLDGTDIQQVRFGAPPAA